MTNKTDKLEQLILLQKAGVEYFCLRQTFGGSDCHIIRILAPLKTLSAENVRVELFHLKIWGYPRLTSHLVPIEDIDVLREDEWRKLAAYSGYADIDIKASVERTKGVTWGEQFEPKGDTVIFPYLGGESKRRKVTYEDAVKHTPETATVRPSEEIMRTKHYDSQVQPINAMQANMSKEEFQGYCLGNIVKYCLRFGKKDGEGLQKEANKIADYAEFLRVHTKGETIDPKVITSRHKED